MDLPNPPADMAARAAGSAGLQATEAELHDPRDRRERGAHGPVKAALSTSRPSSAASPCRPTEAGWPAARTSSVSSRRRGQVDEALSLSSLPLKASLRVTP